MKMRTICLSASILAIFFILSSCHRGNSLVINDKNFNISIHYNGEIEIADDEEGFESISPGGYLNYKSKGARLIATGNNHGEVEYELSFRGAEIDPESPEGKKFIARTIHEMLDCGFDAEGRMNRLYQKGGKEALLAEVDKSNNDYMKRTYLEWLLNNTDLNNDELVLLAGKIQTRIESDYDKSCLLSNFSDHFFRDSSVVQAWLGSVATIKTDYDKSNALKRLSEQQLSETQLASLLQATKGVESDYEKANILRNLIQHDSYGEASFGDIVLAINEVHASYDRKELLKELCNGSIPMGNDFNLLVSSIGHLDGDYDKRELLIELAQKNIQTQEQWKLLILEAVKVTSTYDRAEILISYCNAIPRSESLRPVFMEAAHSIKSDSDYDRVVKAFD